MVAAKLLVVEFNSDVKLEDGYWGTFTFSVPEKYKPFFQGMARHISPRTVSEKEDFLIAASAGKLVTDHPKQEVVDARGMENGLRGGCSMIFYEAKYLGPDVDSAYGRVHMIQDPRSESGGVFGYGTNVGENLSQKSLKMPVALIDKIYYKDFEILVDLK
jgi:hypothetical protein